MKKILYIVEDEESAQFRYQVKNVAEACEASKRWRVEWMLKTEALRDIRKVAKYDLVVVLRQTDKNGEIGRLIGQLRGSGVKVLMDLDDLVFDYRDLPVLMWSTNSKNVAYWAGYFWGIRRIAKKVDGFICTNGFLGGKLKRSFGKPVGVIPNSLNREQMEVSERWVGKKNSMKKVEKVMEKPAKFSIGYFSGSPTHVKDFRLIEGELIRFLDTYEDAVLRVVGDMDFSHKMRGQIERGKVEVTRKVDYLRLQGRIAKVDVNIAPLLVNDFTNCKSELKFFEAAVVETVTVASPTYAFSRAITDGENGYLARPGEWYDKLEYLHQHPEENVRVARTAKEYAWRHYYGKEFLKEVEGVYDHFAK